MRGGLVLLLTVIGVACPNRSCRDGAHIYITSVSYLGDCVSVSVGSRLRLRSAGRCLVLALLCGLCSVCNRSRGRMCMRVWALAFPLRFNRCCSDSRSCVASRLLSRCCSMTDLAQVQKISLMLPVVSCVHSEISFP